MRCAEPIPNLTSVPCVLFMGLLSAVLAVVPSSYADEAAVKDKLRSMEWRVPTPYFRAQLQQPSAVSSNIDQPSDARLTSPVEGDNGATAEDRGPLPEPPKDDLACRAALQKLADFQPVAAPPTTDPYCVTPDPVELRSVSKPLAGSESDTETHNGRITFTGGLVLDCAFALRFAKFVLGPANDLAVQHKGSALSRVVTGQGFTCRRRNNARSGKLSEHALGNGVDIASFRFADGSRQTVVDGKQLSAEEAAFQKALRDAACGPFSTVLGPGSNAAHATHLHFDRGRSKGRKNPYLVCE